MCGLGKDDEMELKAREEKEGWCFLMSVSQTMSICGPDSGERHVGLGKKTSLYFCKFVLAFPGGSVSKESACKAGDPGLIPGSR